MSDTPVLLSEQLPNDGAFRPRELLKRANERLKRIGKHGKRAMLKGQGKYIVLQFTFEGKQHPVGCNCQMSVKGLTEAEQIAEMVTLQLSANQFTWDWLDGLLGKGKKLKPEISQRFCKELIEEYKRHWLKERKGNKSPLYHWYISYRHLEQVMKCSEEIYSDSIAKKIIELSQNNSVSRTLSLNALLHFCQFFQLDTGVIEQYKRKNKPKSKFKNVPNDAEIKRIYQTGFQVKRGTRKSYYYRCAQWQFLYGVLAVYGLRIHEAWNIANWDKPVTFNQGDWVVIEVGEKESEDVLQQYQGESLIIPAITDPANKNHILCIKHNTKTGYRMVMPLSPSGGDWLLEFNLLESSLNLPDIPNPLGRRGTEETSSYKCTSDTCNWFCKQKYGFTPHALRHAYNHRGHSLNINTTVLCQSLGHGIQMNTTTYLRTMPEIRKLENLKLAIESQVKENSELEKALAKIQVLESKNELLEKEIKLLRFQLELLKQESAKT